LDLCTGSAGYAKEQLEVACARAAQGCVLAYTLVERSYEGKDLLMRHNGLADLLFARDWGPACRESLKISTPHFLLNPLTRDMIEDCWRQRDLQKRPIDPRTRKRHAPASSSSSTEVKRRRLLASRRVHP
jgi:hypothetical protein